MIQTAKLGGIFITFRGPLSLSFTAFRCRGHEW